MHDRKLTPKQLEAYLTIKRLMYTQGYPPSQKEIAEAMGISLRPAQKHINALYLKGFISKKHHEPRGIRL